MNKSTFKSEEITVWRALISGWASGGDLSRYSPPILKPIQEIVCFSLEALVTLLAGGYFLLSMCVWTTWVRNTASDLTSIGARRLLQVIV